MAFDYSDLDFYPTKASTIPGNHYRDVYRIARALFSPIRRRTKRKPYVRSTYFRKSKIFFDYFWEHMHQRHPYERTRRLKFFEAALEVISHSRYSPMSSQNPDKKSEMLHRFGGVTKDGHKFYVQIKEHTPTDIKQLMSIFPAK